MAHVSNFVKTEHYTNVRLWKHTNPAVAVGRLSGFGAYNTAYLLLKQDQDEAIVSCPVLCQRWGNRLADRH